MCGIVGFWNLDHKKAQPSVVERMLDRIAYRGPDDRGTWTDGPIALGHVRLSILDLSERGHQPFLTADGIGVLSYNGEVYNFREIRANLELEGIRFFSNTDTEVVLYALHHWGPEKAIPLFNGMFGFAYFDRRTETLWIARDRMGIKPAYIIQNSNLIAFASEIKALLAHPEIVTEPDLHALGSFLTYQRLEGDWTPFKGIEQVSPGSFLKITPKGIEKFIYFDPIRDLDVERILQAQKEDPVKLIAEFEESFRQSVRMHMISDAPLAAMTSGGLDSSLITAFAHEFKPDIVGYVANVKGAIVSEEQKAQTVGKYLGIKIRQIEVDREDLLRLWPTAIWHGDLPNCHANDMPYILVTRACREDGIKVMLTGEGSDELFGGYPWQEKTYQMWRWRRWHSTLIPNHFATRFLGRFHPWLRPINLRRLSQDPFFRSEQLDYSQDLLRQASVLDGGRRLTRTSALFDKLEKVKPLEDRAFLARVLEDWYANLQAVLHRNDRISMAASIESRPPFLENRLLDFALHLPRPLKLNDGKGKWIVKKVAEKRLPHSIVHARKLQFPVDMGTWRTAADLLEGGMVPELFKWGTRETQAILERAKQAPTVIHNLLGVELWARLYLRNESPAELGEALLGLNRKHGVARVG